MSRYRRTYFSGGIYFFTLVTFQRKKILCTDESMALLREAFHYTINKYPFVIEGMVIMPDHLHCIWQMPENDSDYSIRWNQIKGYYSRKIDTGVNHRREKYIWQRRFWEHLIRDEIDLQKHLDYIYYNPVKHGYVQQPIDWQHSTFQREIATKRYMPDWGGDYILDDKMDYE